MKVLVAEKCGFCFGVERAIELAGEMLRDRGEVYCLGDIIHNKQVVGRLAEAGLKVVKELDEIPEVAEGTSEADTPTVLIRSHGCHPALIDEIHKRRLRLVDATCILVKRAQRLVRELHEQGYTVVVNGDPDHPEIQGVVGYAPYVIVVANEGDLEKLPAAGRVAVISQTTHAVEEFGRIVGLIAARGYSEMKVVNTICRETARRQASAVELCRQVDVMFVLGSLHSANTGELAELCRRYNVETFHLQNWQEFRGEYVSGKTVAGVTAGASTPDWIIEEFVEKLRGEGGKG